MEIYSWIYRRWPKFRCLARGLLDDPKFQYYGALNKSPQIRHHSLRDPLSPFSRYNEMSILRNMDDPRLINHLVAVEERAVITSKIEPDMIYYAGQEIELQYHPCNGVRSEICLSSGQALRSGFGPRCVLPNKHAEWQPSGFNIGLSKKDICRLDMAGAFITNILSPAGQSEYSRRLLLEEKAYSTTIPFDPFKIKYINRHGKPLICQREENLSISGPLFRLLDAESLLSWDILLLLLALILIPTAYGGIHLSALHEMFPTTIERTLWKASCFTLIGFTGVIILLMGAIVGLSDFISESDNSWLEGMREWMGPAVREYIQNLTSWLFIVFFLAATLLYFAARIFVVVEAFISLRHVPIGVYQTPPSNFMGYIPHL
ncbi:hypothetical protein NA56DRAFT_696236 [Hyaloscypha hepaticicola]|uniref:Uncharacterized protein n=1 Tax=Hyaloscypha hepaticicola TaxID=2082293 RepID=A0A2J6QQC6_9HELO|nr:hypothetical protein NA56DRAFT_696236 [Hyaloscypha hepaticicola]